VYIINYSAFKSFGVHIRHQITFSNPGSQFHLFMMKMQIFIDEFETVDVESDQLNNPVPAHTRKLHTTFLH
jgi:hypothetical protein